MRRAVTVTLGLWVAGLFAFGQVGNGSFTGTVTDPAGAAIPGAAVEAKNTATGVSYKAATTSTGNYTIADLPVGVYTITVAVMRFKTYTHSNLALPAAQVVREDVALQLGASTDFVTVTAEASLLHTESAELSHNVSIDQLDQLPLLGIGSVNAGSSGYRNPYNTLLTLPGISSYNTSGTFVLNGLGAPFALTETMRIEGQDATSRLYGNYDYTQITQPSADAIQEIAYQTSNYAPEFGQAGIAVINMTMKSGTNQYHGSAYDYSVNEDLNAGYPFSQSGGCISGTTSVKACSSSGGDLGKYRPRSRRNDFGGTMGGPVYIPKVYSGHNKTFWFFNYEEYLETVQYSFNDTVPTSNYLLGNFSQISTNGTCSACAQLGIQTRPLGTPHVQIDPNGNKVYANEIFDPASRAVATSGPLAGQGYATPFQNNTIPLTRFDRLSQLVLKLLPAANNGNFAGNYSVTQDGHRYSTIPAVKIDHNIDANDKLSFYYSENNTQSQIAEPLGSPDGLPNEITTARGTFIPTYTERVNYDRTITPTLLLHLGGGYLHTTLDNHSPFLNFDPSTLGLQGFLIHRNFPNFTGASNASYGGMQTLGTTIQGPNHDEKPTFTANLTWVHGKHTFKAGGELDLIQIYAHPFPTVSFNAGTNATADPFTNTNSYGSFTPGFGFASFLLGDYSGITQSVSTDTREGSQEWALFIQDSWKVTRKLTVDYGLRWDYDTPEHEQYGRLGQIDPTLANTNAGGRPGALQFANTCGCSFYKSAYPFALGPRLGLAYRLDNKTVLRGGWGVNYQFVANAAGGLVSTNGVYNLSANSPSYVPPSAQFVSDLAPGAIQTPQWPVTNPYQYPNLGDVFPTPFVPDGQQNRPPRINQWSAGIQREITRDFVMEADYIGNHAVWTPGGYGFLSQESPQLWASYGLYPIPGTGPAGYNNEADRALLTQSIGSPAVIQAMAARGFTDLLPYSGFPTSQSLQSALFPFPQFGGIEPVNSPTGDTMYNSLQVKATKRFSHNLQAGGAYTWGQGFTRANRQDFFNPLSARWALQQIPPQTLTFNATYIVPKASFLPKYASLIARGWQIGWYSTYQSGAFLTPPNSVVNPNQLLSEDVLVPGQPLYNVANINNIHSYNPQYQQLLNPNAWAPCPTNQTCMAQGNLIKGFRNLRNPSENANIGRNFRIKERMNLQVRGEFVNIFNRTLMTLPQGFPASATANPQAPAAKNALGIYTGGFGVINAYAAPNTTPTLGQLPRTGTLIARFTF